MAVLDDKQVSSVRRHLHQNTHLLSRGCPACGEVNFKVKGNLVFAPFISQEKEIRYKSGMPFVQVHCNNCRHTLFFETIDIEGLDVGMKVHSE